MYHAIAVCLIILLAFCLYNYGPVLWAREHADVGEPTFDASLVDKYRGLLKDPRGLSVNDYALESHIVTKIPLSGDYKILT